MASYEKLLKLLEAARGRRAGNGFARRFDALRRRSRRAVERAGYTPTNLPARPRTIVDRTAGLLRDKLPRGVVYEREARRAWAKRSRRLKK